MKNLSYVGSHCYSSSSSSSSNMAGAGDDGTPALNSSAPLHPASASSTRVAPAVSMPPVVSMPFEFSTSQLTNMTASAGDDVHARFTFNNTAGGAGSSSCMVGAIDRGTVPLDNMAGTKDDGMPNPLTDFVNREAEMDPVLPREFEALAPHVQDEGNALMRNTGAERMEVAAVEPTGSKRQRTPTPTGRTETTGGGEDEHVLEEVVANGGGGVPKRLWMKEHDGSWWDEVSRPSYPAEEFKRLFRMSPATFEMVCGELAAEVGKSDTVLRQAVPVRKRIAACIWRLATGGTLRLVAQRFGIGISTCQRLSADICIAMKNVLMPKFLLWPEGGAPMTAIAAEFEAAYGIPNIVGAIYNTHISIISPKINSYVYCNPHHTKRNKKPSYSVTVQVVVDAVGSFTDISVGHPGSKSDEEVLLESSLSQERGESGQLQAEGKWLVGGTSYPVMDWMLAPYVDKNLTLVQNMYNSKMAGMHKVAKDAAMRLKARWQLLQKRNEINVHDFPITLSACCVLHNICERYGDTLDPELEFNLVDDEVLAKKTVQSEAASLIRDNIANVVFLNGVIGDIGSYL